MSLELTKKIVKVLDDKLARDIEVIKTEDVTIVADYFVIATVSSSAHWQGLYRQVKDYVKANDLEIHVTRKKSPDGDDWNLIDIGPIVVHLMSDAARQFYDLEKLWHSGTVLDFHN